MYALLGITVAALLWCLIWMLFSPIRPLVHRKSGPAERRTVP